MKTKSLKLNSAINIAKTILGIIFPLITFPYASRILGASGIGKVDYAYSVANYFVLFAELGITTYTVREGAKIRDNSDKLNQLGSEILLINLISTVLSYTALVICSFLPAFKEYQNLLVLFGTTMIFNLIGVNWLFNIFEDYIYITIRTLIFQVVSLIALFLFVRTKEDYMIYAGLMVFSSVGSSVYNLFYGRKYFHLVGFKPYYLKKHLKPIFIIFGMGVASQIYLNMDTTMIGYLKGDEEVGLYSASVKINRTLGSLISSACAVLIPRLSYYIKNGMKSEYRNVVHTAVNYIMCMTIPCTFGLILLSPEMIVLFSGEGFREAIPIMRVLGPNIIFSVINGFLVYQIFIPFDREKETLSATIIGALVNVILNYILILPYGAGGAAIATVIAEGCVYLVLRMKMKKFYQDKTLYSEIWKYFVAGAVMFTAGTVIKAINCSMIMEILIVVNVCILVYFIMLWMLRVKLARETIDLVRKAALIRKK